MSDNTNLPDPKSAQKEQQQNLDAIGKEVLESVRALEKLNDTSKNESSASKDTKPTNQRKPPPGAGGSSSYSRSRCLMFFPTSGHRGFDIIQTSDECPPIETLRQMIGYDVQLRLSEPIQNLIDKYHKDEGTVT